MDWPLWPWVPINVYNVIWNKWSEITTDIIWQNCMNVFRDSLPFRRGTFMVQSVSAILAKATHCFQNINIKTNNCLEFFLCFFNFYNKNWLKISSTQLFPLCEVGLRLEYQNQSVSEMAQIIPCSSSSLLEVVSCDRIRFKCCKTQVQPLYKHFRGTM